MLTQIILIYVLGFFVSLFLLHRFKKELDLYNYDPPHPAYYDDFNSNATAFVAYSIVWPIFLLVISIQLMWKILVNISKLFEKINK